MAEYQAHTGLPGFILTLSVMRHVGQPKAITVIWFFAGSLLAVVKRQACCYQQVRHSCLDTVPGLSQFDGFPSALCALKQNKDGVKFL